jgi:hypothetical protein
LRASFSVLQEPISVLISELAVEAHVREVASGEFVSQDSINDGIPKATMGVLHDKIAATGLAVAFITAGML